MADGPRRPKATTAEKQRIDLVMCDLQKEGKRTGGL
jgi:hypothetical protein